MTYKPKILAFAGSLRKDSYNKKLIKIACKGAKDAGAEVTYIDLIDYQMPVYNEDIETKDGLPDNAKKIKELMWAHDGFLISAPEYNSSISGVLKNTIDWASRNLTPDEVYLSCFIGKVACIMSASPGNLGGLRGLVTVRSILENINTMVLPDQKSISKAFEAFTPDGNLKDPKQQEGIINLGKKLAETIAKLKSGALVASSK